MSQPAQLARYPDFYILSFFGNGTRAEAGVQMLSEMFSKRSVEVWGVNYPGYGGSTGPAKVAKIAPVAVTAFDTLNKLADGRPIIVFGSSLGTTAALHVAVQRRVTGVILENPPAIRQMIRGEYGWWNLWLLAEPYSLQVPKDLDNIANAKKVRAPGVFLLGQKDNFVLPKYQAPVRDAYAGEKLVIPVTASGHNAPIRDAALYQLQQSIDWLLAEGSLALRGRKLRADGSQTSPYPITSK